MATLQNIADLAGVSTATVSRSLNTPERVEPTTRAKVADAIKKTGYRRNEMARSLASQSSRTIGLLTDTFSSTYFGALLDSTARTLHKHGYFTLVEAMGASPGNSSSEMQNLAWQSLTSRQVDCVILLSNLIERNVLTSMLAEFPSSVIIGEPLKGVEDRCVTFDHYTGGKLAARYLVEKGHRHLAMITGSTHRNDALERGQGFIDELAANNIKLEADSIFQGAYTVESGRSAARQLLKTRKKFTAIFSHNDEMAAGVISELYSAGIEIPNQMSILGFDNSPIAKAVYPMLTSVSQPIKQMSHSAAMLALKLCKNRNNESNAESPQLRFLPEIIERDSVSQLNTAGK